jgi:hypothetical protein
MSERKRLAALFSRYLVLRSKIESRWSRDREGGKVDELRVRPYI